MVEHGEIKRKFTKIPNDIINNPHLTFSALGFLVWLLSLVDSWQFSISGILGYQKKLGRKVGKTAVRTMVQDLEREGYIVRQSKPSRGPNGTFLSGDWVVYALAAVR